MKNKYGITLFILVIAICFALYKGFTLAIQKTLKATPQIETDPNDKIMIKQRDRMREIRERQEEYMRTQKERMRDLQRR